jgi:hypothetical protein
VTAIQLTKKHRYKQLSRRISKNLQIPKFIIELKLN